MEGPDSKQLPVEPVDTHNTDYDAHPTKKGDILVIDETRNITLVEHETGFWHALRQWPTAMFWALFFSIAVVMAGFDAQIITSFFALPAFQQKFGYEYEGSYIISAPWQSGLNMVSELPAAREIFDTDHGYREIPLGNYLELWHPAIHWSDTVGD